MAKKKNTTHTERYCQFCGRSEDEVTFLLEGLEACICADCVKIADGYLDKIIDIASSFKTGFASSAEIGMNYNDFSFSFKGVFSVNESFAPFSIIGYEYSYNSFYLLFQVGYHF